jgi:ribonuclease P protein component
MSFLILKRQKIREERGKPVIIISKKVSKKATVRNRIRRQIQAAITERAKAGGKSGGITVVVTPEILNKSFKEIQYEISRFIPD